MAWSDESSSEDEEEALSSATVISFSTPYHPLSKPTVDYSLSAFLCSGNVVIMCYVVILAVMAQWVLTDNPETWIVVLIWGDVAFVWMILVSIFWCLDPGRVTREMDSLHAPAPPHPQG